MARIDRLQEAPKRTLQFASVIGREFTHRLLERIADIQVRTEELLQELKTIELIYEKSAFPELAYMFKHALTHEVAYNSLLVQRRKDSTASSAWRSRISIRTGWPSITRFLPTTFRRGRSGARPSNISVRRRRRLHSPSPFVRQSPSMTRLWRRRAISVRR